MCPHTALKVITTALPSIPIDTSIDQLDYLIMAEYLQNTMTHPLSQVNMDTLETQKFDLPIGMVQRSNSTRSTRSDRSVCSTSSSVDSSVVNSPIETSTPTKVTPPPPHFVVLSLWPHATPSQIASYVEGYEDLYPTAKVLLLRSSWTSTSPDLDDVANTLTASLEEKPCSSSQPVLLHLFGQTGALNACNLLRAYRARTTSSLDVRAVVSDTCPHLTASDLYSTFLYSPLQFFTILLSLLLTFAAAAVSLFAYDNTTHRIRADLTNPGLLPPNVRKCFVFPAQEMMFSWCEME